MYKSLASLSLFFFFLIGMVDVWNLVDNCFKCGCNSELVIAFIFALIVALATLGGFVAEAKIPKKNNPPEK